jgi:hypothetical protein
MRMLGVVTRLREYPRNILSSSDQTDLQGSAGNPYSSSCLAQSPQPLSPSGSCLARVSCAAGNRVLINLGTCFMAQDPSPLRGSTNTHLGGSHVLDPAINLGSISSGTGLPPGVSAYQSREGSKLSNVSTDQVQATGSMQQGDQVRVQAGQLVSGSTAAGGPAPMTDQQRDMVGRGLKVIQEEGEGDSSGQGNSSASSGRGSANGTGSGSGSSNIVRTTSGKAPLLMPILAGLAHPHGPGLAADDGDDGSGKIVPESEDTPRAHRPMRSGPPGTSPAVLQLGSAGDSPPQGHPQQQGPGTWTTSPSPTRPSPLGIQRIPSFETVSACFCLYGVGYLAGLRHHVQ